MNKKEAANEAMFNGKKICKTFWVGNKNYIDYVEYNIDCSSGFNVFIDYKGNPFDIIISSDIDVWEIYEEPKEEPNEAGYKSGYAQALEDVLHKVQGMDSE